MSPSAGPVSYDVMVAGLGAMGSAAAWQLARRGMNVLALERFAPGHPWGSSHGESRMIREIYYEAPLYVPILRRAFELWRELEVGAGRRLLRNTGGLMIGPAGGRLIQGARRTAVEHGIPVEVLSAGEIRSRYPAFQPDDLLVAVWDPRAGFLHARRCLATMWEEARRYGAELRFETPVVDWRVSGSGVEVRTPDGTYEAGWLILTVGPWTGPLLTALDLPLEVERQVLFWFEPSGDPSQFEPDRFPVFLAEFGTGRFLYGFPTLETGLKVSIFHEGEVHGSPEEVRRTVRPGEARELQGTLEALLPTAGGRLLGDQVCLFTNTPDEHFLVDFHPEQPRVLLCSACSGHGFKFATAMGEVLADLVTEGESRFDLEPFRIGRLLSC